MVPGFDDAKTIETRARLDDRLGLWAVTYLLFFVKLGPGLALFLVLVFAIWIGWRWLCRKCTRGEAWVWITFDDSLRPSLFADQVERDLCYNDLRGNALFKRANP